MQSLYSIGEREMNECEALGERLWKEKHAALGEKSNLVPFCPQQILQGLNWAWTWDSQVTDCQLITWSMDQPIQSPVTLT